MSQPNIIFIMSDDHAAHAMSCYSSDHGEMLGDFGKWGKPHQELASVQIPLVISGPGIERGVYSQALVDCRI